MMLVLPTMPSTFSVSISFLASDATCPGSVCSVSITYWIGRPLMPPLSLTQSKNAFAVFGMSVKSVPGCLVAIAPSLIGAPVAFLPVPAPHFGAAAGAAVLSGALAALLESSPPPPQAASALAVVSARASTAVGQFRLTALLLLQII